MRKLLAVLVVFISVLMIVGCGDDEEVDKIVNFNTMGGEAIERGVYNLDNINDVFADPDALPTPVRDGFIFVGWYHDEAYEQPFSVSTLASILTESDETTLYAKWEAEVVVETSTISFDSQGGSAVQAVTGDVGSAVSAPTDPTRTGHTFDGWFSDQALTTPFVFGVFPEEDVTVYAGWTVNRYTITYVENGGSQVADETHDFGAAIVEPAVPVREGHTFAGWHSDIALTTPYVFTTMPAQALTLYAKWTVNSYTLTYEDDDGSVIQETVYPFGQSLMGHVPPQAPEKEGFQFSGWSQDLPLTMPASDVTLSAVYEQLVWLYFDANGGTYEFTRMSGTPGTPIVFDEDDPVREGYEFTGWFEDLETTIPLSFAVLQDRDVTIYAGWNEIVPDDVVISFEENGGPAIDDIVGLPGAPVTAPDDPVREGYDFTGWFDDPDLTIPFVFDVMPEMNTTVFVGWVEVIEDVTLFFEENGGSLVDDITGQPGQGFVLPENPVREGYDFTGWFTDAGLTVPFESLVLPSTDLTVYAGWTETQVLPNTFKVQEVSRTETTLTIEVVITGDVFLSAWDVELTYDAQVLQYASNTRYPGTVINPNTSGVIKFNFSDFNNIDQDVTIVTIVFDILAPLPTTIGINVVEAAYVTEMYEILEAEYNESPLSITFE